MVLIYFDIRMFKKQNKVLFDQTFAAPNWMFNVTVVVLALTVIIPSGSWVAGSLFIFGFVIPLYIVRRDRLTRLLEGDESLYKFYLSSDAQGLVIIWLYSMAAIGFILRQILPIWLSSQLEIGNLIISAIFSSSIIFFLVFSASRRFSNQDFLTRIGLKRGNQSVFKVIIIPILLGLFFAYLSAKLITDRQIQPDTPLGDILNTAQSAWAIMLFFLLALGMAPFVEEVIFRGYFFRVISEVKGRMFAICFIALSFAFLHVGQYWGDWLAIGMITILGFVLTLLRAWTGTTLSSVITHYVYNTGVTVIPFFMIVFANPAYLKYQAYYPSLDAKTKIILLKESIKKEPDLADAYNDLAWQYALENKNLDEALSLIDTALSFDASNIAYLDTKAEILFRLGRDKESLEIRRKIAAMDLSKEMKQDQLDKIQKLKKRKQSLPNPH